MKFKYILFIILFSVFILDSNNAYASDNKQALYFINPNNTKDDTMHNYITNIEGNSIEEIPLSYKDTYLFGSHRLNGMDYYLNSFVIMDDNDGLLIEENNFSHIHEYYLLSMKMAGIDNKKLKFKNTNSDSYDDGGLYLLLNYFTKDKSNDVKINTAISIEDLANLDNSLRCYKDSCNYSEWVKNFITNDNEFLSLLNLSLLELKMNFLNIEKDIVLNSNNFKYEYSEENYASLINKLDRANSTIFKHYDTIEVNSKKINDVREEENFKYISNIIKTTVDNVLYNDKFKLNDYISKTLYDTYGEYNKDEINEFSDELSNNLANYLYENLIVFSKDNYYIEAEPLKNVDLNDFKKEWSKNVYGLLSKNFKSHLDSYLDEYYTTLREDFITNKENIETIDDTPNEVKSNDKNLYFKTLTYTSLIILSIIILFIVFKKRKKTK